MKKNFFNLTKILSILSVPVFLASGCAGKNGEVTNAVTANHSGLLSEDKCLPPLFVYAYPDRDENPGLMPPGMLPDTLPQPESEVPSVWLPQLTDAQLKTFSSAGSEKPNPNIRSDVIEIAGNNIWFSDSVYLFSYNKKSSQIETYKVFDVGQILDLYADAQNTLWVAVDQTSSSDDASPLLKYNPSQDQFEAVQDKSELLLPDKDNKLTEIIGHFGGNLWVVFSKQLYTFDLEKHQASVVSEIDREIKVYHAALAPDGKVWFVGNDKTNSENILIYQYDPQSAQLKIAGSPPGNDKVIAEALEIDIDKNGRVWIDNLGWFEPIPDKDIDPSYPYPFVRSFSLLPFPGFIVEGGFKYRYSMVSASFVHSFSDDKIWFSSIAGISNLDPSTGKWCILAKRVPGVELAEDEDGFVWFAYGQLYKYKLEK